MRRRRLLPSKGVLLTLGITFISLIVLSFATLILRNAENSDLRLTELSSIDRLYTLSSSLERSVSRSYFPLTGINMTVNNDTITIVKDTKRPRDLDPNYYQPPSTTDPSILSMKYGDAFVNLIAESLTYKTTTLANTLGFKTLSLLILTFYYPTYTPDYLKSILIYGYGDTWFNLTKDYNFRHTLETGQYGYYELNNNSDLYPINSTMQLFLIGNNLSELNEIRIKARHPTRCPVINWTAGGTRRLSGVADPNNGETNLKITVNTESVDDGGAVYVCASQTQSDAIVNRTISNAVIFSQIIFLDNLTNDIDFPGYNFIYDEPPPVSASKERPVAFIYDSRAETGTVTNVASNILYLVQYDNPIYWEVTLKFAMGPVEVYSTETITSSLPPLNVSRTQRPARFK